MVGDAARRRRRTRASGRADEVALLRRYASRPLARAARGGDPPLHAAGALAGDALPAPDRVARRSRPGRRARPGEGGRRLRSGAREAVRRLRGADDPRRAAAPLPRSRLDGAAAARAPGADDERRRGDHRADRGAGPAADADRARRAPRCLGRGRPRGDRGQPRAAHALARCAAARRRRRPGPRDRDAAGLRARL